MRITLAILLLTTACAPTPQAPPPAVMKPPVISDSAARGAIGQLRSVEGAVVQVKAHTHQGLAFLNFGARFPDMPFSVAIPDSAVGRFGDLTRFEGHRARATGAIWLQDGRNPAMTLTDPAMLELIP
jgi:hypothetical protein